MPLTGHLKIVKLLTKQGDLPLLSPGVAPCYDYTIPYFARAVNSFFYKKK
jgi:hypothetical protein